MKKKKVGSTAIQKRQKRYFYSKNTKNQQADDLQACCKT